MSEKQRSELGHKCHKLHCRVVVTYGIVREDRHPVSYPLCRLGLHTPLQEGGSAYRPRSGAPAVGRPSSVLIGMRSRSCRTEG